MIPLAMSAGPAWGAASGQARPRDEGRCGSSTSPPGLGVFGARSGRDDSHIEPSWAWMKTAAAPLLYWRRWRHAHRPGPPPKVDAAHFLAETRNLPGLGAICTNMPTAQRWRVCEGLKVSADNDPEPMPSVCCRRAGPLAQDFRGVIAHGGHARVHAAVNPTRACSRRAGALCGCGPRTACSSGPAPAPEGCSRAGPGTVWMQRWLRSKPHGRRPAALCY